MKVLKELVPSEQYTSAALGYFDGVHRGHQAVIREAVAAGRKYGLLSTVFTLMQSPRVILKGEAGNNIITTEEKLSLIEELGVRQVYLIDFNSIKDITAEEFVRNVLVGCFRAKHLSCGFNYHFGAGAAGSGDMLEDMCAGYNISVLARPRITMEDRPISSTRIRECIVRGEVKAANRMLGRRYGFHLEVIHGRQLGRQWGTPTLNQQFPEGLVKPRSGVYASVVTVDGKQFCGVTDIGVKPTVGSHQVQIETWMPDYSGRELYGEKIDVRLIDFLRDEQKFSDIELLKREIYRNGQQAREIFQNYIIKESDGNEQRKATGL